MANHKESFALMWYQCTCGARLRAWNSRDGVTPFGINCPSCGGIMSHTDWNKDDKAYAHKPFPGQVVFRDITKADAEQIAHKLLKARGIDPSKHDNLRKLIDSIYGDGRHPKVTHFGVENSQVERQSLMFSILRRLMGYVENGSETTVKLFQDDATKDFFVKVGDRSWFGRSLEEAIENALEDNPPEEWEN